jgi:HlyD family secretion protein
MKNKKVLKYSLIALGALIVLIIIAKKSGWIGKSETIKVSTELVTKRNIVEIVSANGKIQPEVEVKISPDVSGEIVELKVKEGDQVKKGDLLAKINPDMYLSNLDRMVAALNTSKANLANSKARLAQVQAQFTNAKLSFDRNEKLFKDNAISQSEFDAAKSAYEVAKSEVDAANETVIASQYNVKSTEASLKEAKDNLIKTSIFAPVDGTISKLNVEKGERVVGTSQFAGTEIMRIANLSEMEVNVSVNENDIVRVHLGDTALVEVDAYLNRKFKGVVTEIANSANTTGVSADQITNFDVKIRIIRESYADLVSEKDVNKSPFRPGMSATVDIQTKTVYNVLSVPIQSVTTRDDTTGGKKKIEKPVNENTNKDKPDSETEKNKNIAVNEYVFLYIKGAVKLQKVKTGIQDNNYIEILEGLKEKDEVVSAPYRAISKTLKNNDKVKKVKKEELFTSKE